MINTSLNRLAAQRSQPLIRRFIYAEISGRSPLITPIQTDQQSFAHRKTPDAKLDSAFYGDNTPLQRQRHPGLEVIGITAPKVEMLIKVELPNRIWVNLLRQKPAFRKT
ncbi:MAG: hypothetical protein DCF32_19380 [Leptolyngbya sp.]|nr:MAG: hypothetical protein DCF32_19380 [Leptolyngbya sp.]